MSKSLKNFYINNAIMAKIDTQEGKVKIYKNKLIDRRKLEYILCNKCGKNIDIKTYKDYLEIYKTWGYNSNCDNETHEFDVCQDCYDEIIKSLKIPVTKSMRKKRLFFF